MSGAGRRSICAAVREVREWGCRRRARENPHAMTTTKAGTTVDLPHLRVKAQSALPRFRRRNEDRDAPKEYVFAAPFKQKRNIWFMWSAEYFGFINDELLHHDFIPSNVEARELCKVNSEKRDKEANGKPDA